MRWPRIDLIEDWRSFWRLHSVRLAALLGLLEILDLLQQLLPILEQSPLMADIVDSTAYQVTKLVLAVSIIVFRVVKQTPRDQGLSS